MTHQSPTSLPMDPPVAPMTSMERVLTALGQREPDRVPLFLFPVMQGARELGLSIEEYFARPEHVAEGQWRLRAKFGHDCLYNFHYAAIEIEAWGGTTLFRADGPPNAGAPIVRDPEDIQRLSVPRIEDSPSLQRVLEATRLMAGQARGEAPIVAVVMSPFSLPVMQLGFERYLILMHERRDLFEHLMQLNERFCVDWANAQVEAGAHAICYFDPVSSATITSRELFLATGREVARRTIAQFKAPAAMHFASGRILPRVADLFDTGTAVIGVSSHEDLGELKRAAQGRLSLLGNLNGIAMRHWTPEQADVAVRTAIRKAGRGGGFILADNHGEIPWQVPDTVLMAIAQAVARWGRYPLADDQDD
ncbi:uroporphyrinogen decarboxylase family protein [Allochromatium humboldtianum]|nr:uroporphyrinogen decarboxylase family protein [Allochromatium humboldtianum]